MQVHQMKEGAFTKYLQFKILHKRIVTNKKLYKSLKIAAAHTVGQQTNRWNMPS